MSRNGHALEVNAIPMSATTVFPTHAHDRHQIIWSEQGVVEVSVEATRWILPPSRGLWVPAGVPHATRGRDATRELGGAYLVLEGLPAWTGPRVIEMSPLLIALLDHLAGELDDDARARAEALIPDALSPVETQPISLRMPSDDRASVVAQALLADPTISRSLLSWGRSVGASQRTLSRIFLAETGLGFNRWRTTLRVQAALELLAAGGPVARVAEAVGYETTSAFVAAFRRTTGSTPGAYFSPDSPKPDWAGPPPNH